jgi:hypothetical protein
MKQHKEAHQTPFAKREEEEEERDEDTMEGRTRSKHAVHMCRIITTKFPRYQCMLTQKLN